MYKDTKKMKIGDVGIISWNAYEGYDREGVRADIVYAVVKKVSEDKVETLLETRNQGKAESYFDTNFVLLISSQTYDEPKKGIIGNEHKDINIIGDKIENHGGELCEFYLYNYPCHQSSIENPYITLKRNIDLL